VRYIGLYDGRAENAIWGGICRLQEGGAQVMNGAENESSHTTIQMGERTWIPY
jgi:hypothetical protein